MEFGERWHLSPWTRQLLGGRSRGARISWSQPKDQLALLPAWRRFLLDVLHQGLEVGAVADRVEVVVVLEDLEVDEAPSDGAAQCLDGPLAVQLASDPVALAQLVG